MVLGRKKPSDLVLPDPRVSSEHCELCAEDGALVVRDLDSVNGTFVNERRVREARLRDGDLLRLGNTHLVLSLQGDAGAPRGPGAWRSARWWLLAGAVLLLAAGGAVAWRVQREAEAARLRARYATLVRGQIQEDPCAAARPHLDALRATDAAIAGRPIPLAPPGQTLAPRDRERAAALIAIYRDKTARLGLLAQAVAEAQQRERDNLERVSRLGARLRSGADRKVAFWAEGQLAERVARGEAFLAGLQRLARETSRFTDLAQDVALQGGGARARELAAFRFPDGANELWRGCQAEFARSTSGVLGALNAFDEE